MNEELKKKIVEILFPVLKGSRISCNEENACKQCWFPCEVDRLADSLADALIAAGIGDLKEHRIFAGKDGSIKQLYSVEEVEKIVKERKELKDELRSKVEYIHEQDEVIKEYKHRAEVAEKALRNAAPRLKCRGGLGEGFCGVDKCDYYHCNNDEGCVKAHLQQAEKELAEKAI